MGSRHNVFFYIIVLFLLLTAAASYYRFVVLNDYLVSYEIACDPYLSDCFVGCADAACTNTYYYSLVTRHAAEVRALCGESITNCPAAAYCPADNTACVLKACDTSSNCETLDKAKPGVSKNNISTL